jgi:hypothetical protein
MEQWRQDWITKGIQLQTACEIRIIAYRKRAVFWENWAEALGVIVLMLTILTAITLVTSLPDYEQVISPILAGLATIIGTLNVGLKTNDKKASNELAYKMYSALAVDIKYFYEVMANVGTWRGRALANDDLAESYKLLSDRLNGLVSESPILSEPQLVKAEKIARERFTPITSDEVRTSS